MSGIWENTVSISTIKKWFKKFGEDDFDLNDKAHFGRPHETKNVPLQERMQVNQSTIQRRPWQSTKNRSLGSA